MLIDWLRKPLTKMGAKSNIICLSVAFATTITNNGSIVSLSSREVPSLTRRCNYIVLAQRQVEKLLQEL